MVWVYVEVLAVGGQLLPLWNDDGGLQEGIQCLSVKFNDLPLYPALLRRAVIRVIDVRVELLHKCHINLLLQQEGELSVPLPPLQLVIKFIT